MSASVEERRPEKDLGFYLGAFFCLLADENDNHHAPSNKTDLMIFLSSRWGMNGEKAPSFLRKPPRFTYEVTPWSDKVNDVLSRWKLSGLMFHVLDSDEGAYWVRYSFKEFYEDKMNLEEAEYLKQLALDYLDFVSEG
ncbi:MAG: hypothetical protein PHU86_03415 [Patescibacteria group bacterium]|nr:hypothetical protein [Patescibacteria group bacterium]